MDLEQLNKQLLEAYPKMWLIAAGISGDHNMADDIVQDAALVVAKRQTSFVQGTNFAAWMAKIVRLTALNYTRKYQRQRTYPADPNQLQHVVGRMNVEREPLTNGSAAMADDLAPDQQHFDDEVLNALNMLSETARTCLLLRTVEDLSYREISELLDVSENTAMSHVHRSKQRLRERLQMSTMPKGQQK